MKKYLISEKGIFYKANLHCHSVISDGKLTVGELKKIYMEKGYSIIAFTDHGAFLTHNELTDESFLALNGYEIDVSGYNLRGQRKTCHFCCIALDNDKTAQKICYTSKHFEKNKEYIDMVEGEEIRSLEYSPEAISEIMREARDNGFFVTYNHPTWSLETYEQYANYHGMHAMEIVNFACICEGFDEHNETAYDEMLRDGERIFCVATDDNHNHYPVDTPRCDSFGGFTVIKAEKLAYKDITDALLAGNFYASEGPEITDLWYEDGKVHIQSSEAVRITYMAGRRKARVACSDGDTPITEAAFDIVPEDVYFRITVHDKNGKKAYTNAYFVDELLD